jgi:hypothetical protein
VSKLAPLFEFIFRAFGQLSEYEGDAGRKKGSAEYFGHIDEVQSNFVRGWVARDGPAGKVTISIPNAPRMTVYPDHDRPDVERAGFPLRSGFKVSFRAPIRAGTTISVTLNESHLMNSPWLFRSEKDKLA